MPGRIYPPEEERKARLRIIATKRLYRRTKAEIVRDNARQKAYHARPEVKLRRQIAQRLWKAKYSIPSQPLIEGQPKPWQLTTQRQIRLTTDA